MARVLVLVCLVLSLALGCASSSWKTFRNDGVTVRYPSNWHATRWRLTPVTSPVQVLAVASYALPRGKAGADGCSPKEALDRLPPSGVFLFGWEYDRPGLSGVRRSDFPPRPEHFVLKGPTGFECLGPSFVVTFREAGRLFQIHVVLGPKAGADERAAALKVLDSLQVAQLGR
jgi:hypothetical protein